MREAGRVGPWEMRAWHDLMALNKEPKVGRVGRLWCVTPILVDILVGYPQFLWVRLGHELQSISPARPVCYTTGLGLEMGWPGRPMGRPDLFSNSTRSPAMAVHERAEAKVVVPQPWP